MADPLVVTSGAILSATFLASATGKAADVRGTREWISQLGIRWAMGAATVAVGAEFLLSWAFAVTPAAAGAAALLFLAVATVALARAQALGVGCSCFGSNTRVQGRHYLRNALLIALALVLIWRAGSVNDGRVALLILAVSTLCVWANAIRRLPRLRGLEL